jgi:hypothetical protein
MRGLHYLVSSAKPARGFLLPGEPHCGDNDTSGGGRVGANSSSSGARLESSSVGGWDSSGVARAVLAGVVGASCVGRSGSSRVISSI